MPNFRTYVNIREVDAVHILVKRYGWGGGRPSAECCTPLSLAIPSMRFWRGRSPRAANMHTNDSSEGDKGMDAERVI